ncbi:MAG: PAS domain S-box protein [Oculatellaceae cyanobacterium Prado106]|jgi:PAS domain S-box-containing protein|nr:PAS domain S-box protein [Oculatellaceae cyanobacterium Prado106]
MIPAHDSTHTPAQLLTELQTLRSQLTHLSQAEAALQQSEAMYRLLFENNPNPMCIYDPQTWKFLAVNEAAIQLHGYTAAEFATLTIADIRPPEDVPILRAALVDSLQRSHSQVGIWRHQKKDGTLVQVEVTAHTITWSGLSARCVLMKDVTKEQAAIREQQLAETALKQAKADLEQRVIERTAELSQSNDRLHQELQQRTHIEATLREADRRWRTLLDHVRLIVVGLDADGNISYANPFFLEVCGYTADELLGKNWFETCLPQRLRPQVSMVFREFLEQSFHTYYENAIVTKDGKELVIAWNNTLLRSPHNGIIGTLSIGEDITTRREMDRLKDELISVISHELKTPLTSIQCALNLLSDRLVTLESARGQRVLEIAVEGSDRLVRLVEDILDLERLNSGKIKLIQQPCNLADLIHQAIDLMQTMADIAGIDLCVDLDESTKTLSIALDPDRILQVLTNLISNALNFSPTGTTVHLTTQTTTTLTATTLQVTLQDQGRGIPPTHLETIFDRFHQVDATDSRQKGGTGLGLAICRSIIQQHGGQIWATSKLGEGSRFVFTLPLGE